MKMGERVRHRKKDFLRKKETKEERLQKRRRKKQTLRRKESSGNLQAECLPGEM